jgi:biopolymer transport protein ExbB/TolQ
MDITTMSATDMFFIVMVFSVMTFGISVLVFIRHKNMLKTLDKLCDKQIALEDELDDVKKGMRSVRKSA